MSEQLKFTGKNLEDAKRQAAARLGVSEKNLVIESVETEGNFLFGKKVTISVRPESLSHGDETSFLKGLLQVSHIPCEVHRREEEDRIVLDVKSPDGGLLIGKGGQGLEAIQYLMNKVAARRKWSEKPILVDVEAYRERRIERLTAKAERMADRAKSEGKAVTLEPLNAYERRAVHMALKKIDGISTRSLGDGPYRRIRIVPESAETGKGV